MLPAFSNLIRHAIAVGQLFIRQNPTLAILAFHQALVKHHQQVVCHLHANRLLTLGGENINIPVNRHNRVIGVQTVQHQVTGVSRFQGNGNALTIAHLANQDNVRGFTENIPQSFMESLGIKPDLALVDVTVLVTIQGLDRVFYSNDLSRFFSIDEIDHGRKSCRHAMTIRTGHQDQTLRFKRKGLEPFGQTEARHSRDFFDDMTHGN